MADLNIAEILYDDGGIHYRYARRMSPDGTRWIRQGPFFCYHPNGTPASEGEYADDQEQGLWTDYYPNGQMAARGQYEDGKKVGRWEYWRENGEVEED